MSVGIGVSVGWVVVVRYITKTGSRIVMTRAGVFIIFKERKFNVNLFLGSSLVHYCFDMMDDCSTVRIDSAPVHILVS